MSTRIEYDELCKRIRHYNYFYYTLDTSVIPDSVYDQLLVALKLMEQQHPEWVTKESPTQTVGHAVYDSHFQLVRRNKPMLSLDNVFTPDEAIDWTIDVHGDIYSRKTGAQGEIVLEWKMDGLSLDCDYPYDTIETATTRGDGTIGEDVTPNALMIEGIPRILKTPLIGGVHVIGEVVVRLSDYHEINRELEAAGKKTFANPRNYAAGSLRQKDPRITRERKLVFVAHGLERVVELEEDYSWYDDQAWLIENGFIVADTGKRLNHDIPAVSSNIPNVLAECLAERPNYPYEVDGLVFKVVKHSHRKQLGYTSKFPRWARAYKFPASKGETRLLSVDRQVGRTGKLTPMARIEPIFVHGTTISNVTIHNLKELDRHQLFEGCYVEISRAGDVIPYLERRITDRTDQPVYGEVEKCPCCDTKVVVIVGKKTKENPEGSRTEYCPNSKCPDRQIAHLKYCTHRDVLNIKGLGDETVVKLHEHGVVDVTRPLSLLMLTKDDFLKIGESDRMAEKLAMAVVVAKATLDLPRVITALGISGAADGTAERLAREIRSLDDISKASVERMMQIRDIGGVTAQSIFEFFDEDNRRPPEESAWRPYVGEQHLKAPDALGWLFQPGTTFVVTGSKFGGKSRKDLEKWFKQNGATVSSSVTKSTVTLYCGTKYTAHKLETAKQLGIPYVIYNETGIAETNIENPIELNF